MHLSREQIDGLSLELGVKADLLLAHVLVHYIHQGHPYHMLMRSANAVPWIEHGQYLLLVRLDASDEFWRIRDQLARKYGLPTY